MHVGDNRELCEEFGIPPTGENLRRMRTIMDELLTWNHSVERPTATVDYSVRICEVQRRLIQKTFSEQSAPVL